jgi:tetratricopeptide (TPR) repeat protein
MGYNQSVNMRRLTTLIIFFLVFFGTSQTKELDSLSVELAFKTVDSLKVDTSLEIIEKLYYSKDYDLALVYIKQSEKLASTINYLKGTAAVTYYKALIYAKKQDYINAKAGYNRAKAIYTKLKDTISLAKIDNSLGLLELQRGNFKEGLKYVLPAVKELERKGLRQELRHAYAGLGEVYFKMHNLNKAIEYNLKALEIQRYLNDKGGIILTKVMVYIKPI